MKYITRFADGSSVLCDRCGGHPEGVYIFGQHWVCRECLRPEDIFHYGYKLAVADEEMRKLVLSKYNSI